MLMLMLTLMPDADADADAGTLTPMLMLFENSPSPTPINHSTLTTQTKPKSEMITTFLDVSKHKTPHISTPHSFAVITTSAPVLLSCSPIFLLVSLLLPTMTEGAIGPSPPPLFPCVKILPTR